MAIKTLLNQHLNQHRIWIQSWLKRNDPGLTNPTLRYRWLPTAIATLFVTTLFLARIWQPLERLVHEYVFSLHSVRPLPAWWGGALLLLGLGVGGVLAPLPLRYQLQIWGGLVLGWGTFGVVLIPQGYRVPIVSPLVLFGLNSAALAIAELVRLYFALRQSEERYALAARGSNEGLWDWNLKQDSIYLSARWQQMLGYHENELGYSPQEWFDRVHPLDITLLKGAIAEHLQGYTAQFEQEYRLRHQDGSYRWMVGRGIAVRNADGVPERMVGSQTDITQRKQTEEELWRSAFFDRLTNLPNRAGLTHHLQQALNRASQYSLTAFAVLWLDIDCFEVINNSLGSIVGDRLLAAVAQRLKSFLSPDDIVARMGGDEFAILLNQIQDANDAIRMADRVQQVLSLPFNIDEQEVFVTVSIGIALSSAHYSQPEHLLCDADTAMHRAKASGRAQCQVFDKAMRTRMVVKLLLENDLRRAIAQDVYDQGKELQLLYQPIVHLATGRLAGFEALVRWQHPEQGILSPQKFISMAEETGLIVPMSWWVLRQACRQMRKWQLAFPEDFSLTISVNLSSQQFSMAGLIEYIEQILHETKLDGSNLKLEMTESMVMENPAAVVTVLHQIRSLGIQIAIDDFGTGYSSLSYLARFPVNTLKIDRSFVRNINLSDDSLEIVRTIHVLAHNLGMDVTAEGVETVEQAEQLRRMRCEYGQGYFFSQPLEAEAITTLLQRRCCNNGWIEWLN